jgi:hypothetical protein
MTQTAQARYRTINNGRGKIPASIPERLVFLADHVGKTIHQVDQAIVDTSHKTHNRSDHIVDERSGDRDGFPSYFRNRLLNPVQDMRHHFRTGADYLKDVIAYSGYEMRKQIATGIGHPP